MDIFSILYDYDHAEINVICVAAVLTVVVYTMDPKLSISIHCQLYGRVITYDILITHTAFIGINPYNRFMIFDIERMYTYVSDRYNTRLCIIDL